MNTTTKPHPPTRNDSLAIKRRRELQARLALCCEGCECPFVMFCDRCDAETHQGYSTEASTLTCVRCGALTLTALTLREVSRKVLHSRITSNGLGQEGGMMSYSISVTPLHPDPCYNTETGRWDHAWEFLRRNDAGFVNFKCSECSKVIEREM